MSARVGGPEPPQIQREVLKVLKSEPVGQIKIQAARDTLSVDAFSELPQTLQGAGGI